ncbi:glycosyl hydrolase [Colwelliaceae bacterium BS250]
MNKQLYTLLKIVSLCSVLITFPNSATDAVDLESGFKNPPNSAKPQTWWHWMDGNVSVEGINADLQAMNKIGLGGVQIFEVGVAIPQGPVGTFDEAHMKVYQAAFDKADELGMEVTLHNSPGWTSSGGPWITPDKAMQLLVWTDQTVIGDGSEQKIFLTQPFTRAGYYEDIKVLAFPTPKAEQQSFRKAVAKVVAVDDTKFVRTEPRIMDGDWNTFYEVKNSSDGSPNYVTFEFAAPYTIRSVTLMSGQRSSKVFCDLEASDDGQTYRKISSFNASATRENEVIETTRVPTTTARYFRVKFRGEAAVREIEFSGGMRISNLAAKSAQTHKNNPAPDFSQKVDQQYVIDPEQIIDLSAHFDGKHFVNWQPPKGHWTIMRFGHTFSGKINHPAPVSGQGLEVDKLDASAVKFHFDEALTKIEKKLGSKVLGNKLHRTLIDSYEVGMQNWSKTLPAQFEARKGYSLYTHLPILAGRYVKSSDHSEKFLWDFKKTLSELYAENYVGTFRDLAHERGMTLSIEPYGDGPFDDFLAGSKADIPMGEFWSRLNHNNLAMGLPARLAHSYGMRVGSDQIIEAEAFTGAPKNTAWRNYPYAMKAQGDLAFSQGINRFVFHRYAHQPNVHAYPGMTMGPWGFHFERSNLWFDKAKPWIDYLSRSQFLLQQGNSTADVVYFTGENSPVTTMKDSDLLFQLPAGYHYDFVNAEVLLNRMKVKNGQLILPDGVTYQLLVFNASSKHMSFAVLKKIQQLLLEGATIVSPRPLFSPSLSDETFATAYQSLVNKLWGSIDGKLITENKVGKGRLIFGKTAQQSLAAVNSRPDFQFTSSNPGSRINFIHRRVDEQELYFVANLQRQPEEIIAQFRVTGMQPELWHPETGVIKDLQNYSFEGDKTTIKLSFAEAESYFILFRKVIEEAPLSKIEPATPAKKIDLATVVDNFSYSVWIKPETYMFPPKEALKRNAKTFGRAPVVFPSPGEDLYGKGHSSVGFAAGTNVIAIYERESKITTAVSVVQTSLTGWNHLAIVYRDGVPEIHLNGELIKTGLVSDKLKHPGHDAKPEGLTWSHFEGDTTALAFVAHAMSAEEISKIVKVGLPEPVLPPDANVLQEIKGDWSLSFTSPAKTPANRNLSTLTPWNDSSDPDLKYFSGTGTYTISFEVMSALPDKLFLDLGRLENFAELTLNGHDLGLLWKPPYVVDVSDKLVPGNNTLSIAVTNLWPNRLIGDARGEQAFTTGNRLRELPEWYRKGEKMPSQSKVSTFTTWKHYPKDHALLEAGLRGPVRIYTTK